MATIKELIPIDTDSISGVTISNSQAQFLANTNVAGTVYGTACVVTNSSKDIASLRNITATLLNVQNITFSGTITGTGTASITGVTFSTLTLASPTINTAISGSAINNFSTSVIQDSDTVVPTSKNVIQYVNGRISNDSWTASTADTASRTAIAAKIAADIASQTFNNETLGGTTIINNAVRFNSRSTGTASTIAWNSYNRAERTAGAASITYTFTAPAGPTNLILVVKFTTSSTLTLPAGIIWQNSTTPDLTGVNTDIKIFSFYYDGSNYYGSMGEW